MKIKVVSPIRYGLEDQSCLPSQMSFFSQLHNERIIAVQRSPISNRVILLVIKKIRVTVNELSAAPDIELDEVLLERVFDAAVAERTAQELLADEVATKPTGSPATKKAKKGKHER